MDFEDDDIAADIAAAIDTHGSPGETPAVATTPAVAQPSEAKPTAPPPSEGERARDESGKFVAKEPAPAAQEKNQQTAVPAETATGTQAPAQTVEAIPAPAHWKGDGKIAWASLSKEVQQAINEDYANVSKTQGELQTLKSAIGDDRLRKYALTFGDTAQGLKQLFQISDFAEQKPEAFVLWYAQQRGIDLSRLVQGGGQGQQPNDQPLHPLQQEVVQLRNELQQFRQQQNQGQTQALQSEIDRFASDPTHPYFNDVRPEMAALMNQGSAKTLGEAYEMAVWAKPNIRTSLIEAERKKAFEANAATVQRASAAAVSITGAPKGGKPPEEESDQDLEATIRKNVERVFA